MLKKPLVLDADGNPQQLQTGDTVATNKDVIALTNANAGSLVIATPVYDSDDGACDKARANVAATAGCIGLVLDTTVATTASANIQTDGEFVATTTQWDAVTGQTGGLTPNAYYYVDTATAGKLTPTCPSSGLITHIGRATSPTNLQLNIQNPILL